MSAAPRQRLPDETATLHPMYPDGRRVVNTSPARNHLRSLLLRAQKERKEKGAVPLYDGSLHVTLPREGLGVVSDEHTQFELRPGEPVFAFMPPEVGGRVAPQARNRPRTAVGIPVLSTFCWATRQSGESDEEAIERIRASIFPVGIVPEVGSKQDRNGNGTAVTGGIMTVVAQADNIIAGQLVEFDLQLPSKLASGAGRPDHKSGERPIAVLKPVRPDQRMARHYTNYKMAIKSLRKVWADVQRDRAAGKAIPWLHWPLTDERDRLWFDVLRGQAGLSVWMNDAKSRPGGADGVGPAAGTLDDAPIEQLVVTAIRGPYLDAPSFSKIYGFMLLGCDHINLDANRFVAGRALSSALVKDEFELQLGRTGY